MITEIESGMKICAAKEILKDSDYDHDLPLVVWWGSGTDIVWPFIFADNIIKDV